MTSKTAITAVPILPLLAGRWSPRSYDTNYVLTHDEWVSILEAARWAPSSSNGQPWRFSIAHRGTELHSAVAAATSGFNQEWSPKASGYIVVSIPKFEKDGVTPHKSARYDCGLAVSQLTIQAEHLGLAVHNMGGFNSAAMAEAINLPEDREVLIVIAVGKAASADLLEEPARTRELAQRTRLPLEELILTGDI